MFTEEYDHWFSALMGTAVVSFGFSSEAALTIDKKAFLDSFKEGMTPYEALAEDMSYA